MSDKWPALPGRAWMVPLDRADDPRPVQITILDETETNYKISAFAGHAFIIDKPSLSVYSTEAAAWRALRDLWISRAANLKRLMTEAEHTARRVSEMAAEAAKGDEG